MATFTFKCPQCNAEIEIEQNKAPECQKCKVTMKRVFTPPMIIIHSDLKYSDEADNMLKDFYKGQSELDRGELTDMEMDISKEYLVKRAEKLGIDQGYYTGNPPKLSKEEMKKKAEEQLRILKKYKK